MRIAVIVVVAASLAALAQTSAAQQPEQVIAFLDKDRDGKVSLNDYLHFQLPRIAQFDADKDGELNLAEFRESLEGRGKKNAEKSFRAFNSGRGRTLSQADFLGYHAYVFKTFVDKDRDGFMSAPEWSALMEGPG